MVCLIMFGPRDPQTEGVQIWTITDTHQLVWEKVSERDLDLVLLLSKVFVQEVLLHCTAEVASN